MLKIQNLPGRGEANNVLRQTIKKGKRVADTAICEFAKFGAPAVGTFVSLKQQGHGDLYSGFAALISGVFTKIALDFIEAGKASRRALNFVYSSPKIKNFNLRNSRIHKTDISRLNVLRILKD